MKSPFHNNAIIGMATSLIDQETDFSIICFGKEAEDGSMHLDVRLSGEASVADMNAAGSVLFEQLSKLIAELKSKHDTAQLPNSGD